MPELEFRKRAVAALQTGDAYLVPAELSLVYELSPSPDGKDSPEKAAFEKR